MTLTSPPVENDQAPEAPPAPRASAGRAVGIVLGALLVAALLNAEALARVADQQPYGWRRDASVAVTRPIRAVADAAGLTAPRRWLDRLTGRDDQFSTRSFGGGVQLARDVDLERAPAPPAPPTASPATTAPPEPQRRTPTAGKPLEVLFAGDSLIGHLADGFARHTASSGIVRTRSEVHIGTGLARPDVLDWASFLSKRLTEQRTEVVYLMFGGNDDQALRGVDGEPPALFTRAWKREYRRRVGLMMDIAAGKNRTVVWIGVPSVTRDRLNRARLIMNEVAREEARKRELVYYVSTDAVIAPGGRYRRQLTVRGGTVEVRAPDGVHVTPTGADLIAPRLYERIAEEWHLDDR